MKIVCVGQNYRAHTAEMGGEVSAEPLLFGKFATTLIGPGDAIVLPRESTHVDAEAELAVVIGKKVRRVSLERALDAVAGYVCANDVSARDLQYGTANGRAARASTPSARSDRASRCRSRSSATAAASASSSG